MGLFDAIFWVLDAENQELSWYQLCRLQRFLRQPTVPPLTAKLASRRISVFSGSWKRKWSHFDKSFITGWTGSCQMSALVQIMACRLFDAKPLSKPMLTFWQLPVKPVMKFSSRWQHFRFGAGFVVMCVAAASETVCPFFSDPRGLSTGPSRWRRWRRRSRADSRPSRNAWKVSTLCSRLFHTPTRTTSCGCFISEAIRHVEQTNFVEALYAVFLITGFRLQLLLNTSFWHLNVVQCTRTAPVAQIPQCTSLISHNALLCKRNVHTRTQICYKMLHCGIFVRCIVRFLRTCRKNPTMH